MTDRKKAFDVETAMRILAETDRLIDSALTEEERKAVAGLRPDGGRQVARELYAAGQTLHAAESLALLATAGALEALAEKVRAVLRVKQERLREQLLDVYYATAPAGSMEQTG